MRTSAYEAPAFFAESSAAFVTSRSSGSTTSPRASAMRENASVAAEAPMN